MTGEVWYEARDVCRFLHRFEIDMPHPSWLVNVWVTNMVTMFRLQLRGLNDLRDKTIEAWKQKYLDRNVYEDRDLEMTSKCSVDLDAQMASVEAALAER